MGQGTISSAAEACDSRKLMSLFRRGRGDDQDTAPSDVVFNALLLRLYTWRSGL